MPWMATTSRWIIFRPGERRVFCFLNKLATNPRLSVSQLAKVFAKELDDAKLLPEEGWKLVESVEKSQTYPIIDPGRGIPLMCSLAEVISPALVLPRHQVSSLGRATRKVGIVLLLLILEYCQDQAYLQIYRETLSGFFIR